MRARARVEKVMRNTYARVGLRWLQEGLSSPSDGAIRGCARPHGAPPVGEQYLFASLFHRLRRCAPPPPAKKSYFFNIAIPGRLIKHRERALQAGNPG